MFLDDLEKESYIMTERVLGNLKRNRNTDAILCHYPLCRKPINVGDKVISKSSKHKRVGRQNNLYHFECYVKTFVA